jgi:phospholipid/cholesterol/gamma-HCH transport system permease protein
MSEPRITISTRMSDRVCDVRLAGDWRGQAPAPTSVDVLREATGCSVIVCDASGVTGWHSALPVFCLQLKRGCEAAGIDCRWMGLPEGVRRLLALAAAAPVRSVAHRGPGHWLARIADRTQVAWAAGVDGLAFVGEVVAGFGRLFSGRSACRRSDVTAFMVACGAEALPIISLISILVGLIFAFVGAMQLVMFGAQIYVAGLVGIAVVRVMGAVMTGIVLAGRTGAAFAAQLGTMQVNEEVDALATLGVEPIDFLVLPRLIALALMMPLLCLYASAMGILGGLAVGVWLFEITPLEYIQMTRDVVRLQDLWVGLLHGTIFGVLVALTGCYKGMRCGRNAAAVGEATTGAVVKGIISIIVATAIVTVMCNALGI